MCIHIVIVIFDSVMLASNVDKFPEYFTLVELGLADYYV